MLYELSSNLENLLSEVSMLIWNISVEYFFSKWPAKFDIFFTKIFFSTVIYESLISRNWTIYEFIDKLSIFTCSLFQKLSITCIFKTMEEFGDAGRTKLRVVDNRAVPWS